MNGIQIFQNNQFGQIRVATNENGEPMFVAKDVCEVLGISKYRDALDRMDADESPAALTIINLTSYETID